MPQVRMPAVAGLFYPDDPAELRQTVLSFLARAAPGPVVPKALIAPHAGYIYSGPVAASAYALLEPVKQVIRRVVLLGPSHRLPFSGLALSAAETFATPLGDIAVDREAVESIQVLSQVQVLDAAHAMEHSLEVHLPFLQLALADFKLVPLVVGDATPAEVAEVIECLWGGRETLIVVSTDLSHYHDYDTARRIDAQTSARIESLVSPDIEPEQACGCRPVNGLIQAATRRQLHATLLDLRNSGDTAGPRDRVVGYGAYAVA